jgi:hypothetical protein
MLLQKGINSYSSVSDADLYFAGRIDASEWENADQKRKEQALITSTKYLDGLQYAGSIKDVSQELSFPRIGKYYDPKFGMFRDLDPIPKRLIQAVQEFALHLLKNEGLLDNTGSIIELEISSIKLNKIKNPSILPSFIQEILNPLKINGGANTWWRAN